MDATFPAPNGPRYGRIRFIGKFGFIGDSVCVGSESIALTGRAHHGNGFTPAIATEISDNELENIAGGLAGAGAEIAGHGASLNVGGFVGGGASICPGRCRQRGGSPAPPWPRCRPAVQG